MLRLEKLELLGFKSFFSRTEFVFNEHITAVVGPNGCGKSNIGDALNWVIGEQSVKSLRGDRMEDVIFNGSEARRPLGMAEVSLHLKNGSGGAEESLVITRRLFRSGESEYLMNGERSRLRDIQEALERINIGSGVYSIIEQGKVDAALSSRPRERRVLIEEAAGIALYKTRKRQAEAKLEATEANLLRVNDIIQEIERQVGSLKRQAARARRYARTVEEITRHERILLFHEHERLESEHQEVDRREQAARLRESETAAAMAAVEARFEEERRQCDQMEALWRQRSADLHGIERAMDGLEREIVVARDLVAACGAEDGSVQEEVAALSARLEETNRQIARRREDRSGVETMVVSLTAERERLETARREIDDRIDGLESALTGLRSVFLQAVDARSDARNRRRHLEEDRDELARGLTALERERAAAAEQLSERRREREVRESGLAEAARETALLAERLAAGRETSARLGETIEREEARREEARHRLHGTEERLRALEEMESTTASARDLLEGLATHEGILADDLAVPAHLEGAVETYLSSHLEAAVVPGQENALRGIASLKHAGRGRAGFLPIARDPAGQTPLAIPAAVREDAGFVGRLADLVELEPARRAALLPAVVGAIVVSDLETAARLRRLAPLFDYLTLDGDVLHTSGLIEGGAKRPEGTGVLTRRRLRADLGVAIETGRSHLTGLEILIRGLESEHAEAVRAVETLAASLAGQEKDLVAMRLSVQTAVDEEARAQTKVATIDQERRINAEESSAVAQELERIGRTLEELEQARAAREHEIGRSQEDIASLRAASAETGESLAASRASLSAATQRLEAITSDLARLLETDREHRDRLDRLAARRMELDRRAVEAAGRQRSASADLEQLAARRAALETAVKEGEVETGERRRQLDQIGLRVREARGELEEAREARERITIEKERVAADLRHLVTDALTAATAPGGDPPGLADLFSAITPEEKALDPGTLRATLSELRERRDRMGPVNMLALDEFRELEERLGFLTTQRDDLTQAVASLKETIARINRTSRERFMDAFEKIRAGFSETFRTLFGGGRSDLRLMTEEGQDDVLECGLEIIAQPPGKRLQSVTLLSGGEKALTAIALLFAIFRYRPSPFCLLDEVDAPLDEANVIRFNQLLRSMAGGTQFVMITHNRCSMESADVLYGITMEEAGVSRAMSVVLGGESNRSEMVRSLPALLAQRHRGNGRHAPPRTGDLPS